MMQNEEIADATIRANQLRVVYSNQKIAATTALNSAMGPLLEICMVQTNSQGAYVYRLDRSGNVLELMAWRGSRPTDIPSYSVQVDGKASTWYRGLTANTAVEKSAWQDWRFQNLPEFPQNRFESAVSVSVLE